MSKSVGAMQFARAPLRAASAMAALALALASGSADAADLVIAAPPAPPVAAPGPVYLVTIEANVVAAPFGLEANAATAIDMVLPSGWGFKFVGDAHALRTGDGSTFWEYALGRLYRAFGNATVGAYIAADMGQTPGSGSFRYGRVGIDGDYVTEGIELAFVAAALFDEGVYDGAKAMTIGNFTLGRHVEISTLASLTRSVGFSAQGQVDVRVGYRIGSVTPFLRLTVNAFPDFGYAPSFGADFKHAVGGGPLTLLGHYEVYFGSDIGFSGFEATTGFEYSIGDGPLAVRGHATYFGGAAWEAGLGIGLRYGGGRLRGFASDVYPP